MAIEGNKPIREIGLKCGHCGTHQRSMIFLGDETTFESATTSGNTQQCGNPACGKMMNVNKENMRYITSDGKGGFMGDEFSDNKA